MDQEAKQQNMNLNLEKNGIWNKNCIKNFKNTPFKFKTNVA